VAWKLDFPVADACDPMTCNACKRYGRGYHKKIKYPAFMDAIICLYNDSEKFKTLPYPGSLLEQPYDIMEYFKVIKRVIEKHRQDEIDGKILEGIHEKQMGELNRG
jgi:hypothetical protein